MRGIDSMAESVHPDESIPPDESMPKNRLPAVINFLKYHLSTIFKQLPARAKVH
jgi:hypothetical protein